MSDVDVRQLQREAEATSDKAVWTACARDLIRLERFDEAGHALLKAQTLGGHPQTLLDALAPTTNTSWVVKHLTGLRQGSYPPVCDEHLDCVTWSADGRRVFGATGYTGHIVEWDVETSSQRVLHQVPGGRYRMTVNAKGLGHFRLAASDSGRRLAISILKAIRILDLQTGVLGPEIVAISKDAHATFAVRDDPPAVICADDGRVTGWLLDGSNGRANEHPFLEHEVVDASVDRSGAVSALAFDSVWRAGRRVAGPLELRLYDSLASQARVRKPLMEQPPERLDRLSVDGAGLGAVVCLGDDRVRRFDPCGTETCTWPVSLDWGHRTVGAWGGVALLKGLVLLLPEVSTEVRVRAHASFSVRPLFMAGAWSPSGRKLAFTHDWGDVRVVEASG